MQHGSIHMQLAAAYEPAHVSQKINICVAYEYK